MQPSTGATIDGSTGKLIPLPARPRVLRLATVREVRLELARLYRDAREGKVLAADAAKFGKGGRGQRHSGPEAIPLAEHLSVALLDLDVGFHLHAFALGADSPDMD